MVASQYLLLSMTVVVRASVYQQGVVRGTAGFTDRQNSID